VLIFLLKTFNWVTLNKLAWLCRFFWFFPYRSRGSKLWLHDYGLKVELFELKFLFLFLRLGELAWTYEHRWCWPRPRHLRRINLPKDWFLYLRGRQLLPLRRRRRWRVLWVVQVRLSGVGAWDGALSCDAGCDLLLKLILLSLLHHHLVLVKLLNRIGVDVLEEIWWVALGGLMGCGLRVLGLLLYPQIFGGFKVVAEYGNNLLDLIVCILVHEEAGVLNFLCRFLIHAKLHFNLSAPWRLIVDLCQTLVDKVWQELVDGEL